MVSTRSAARASAQGDKATRGRSEASTQTEPMGELMSPYLLACGGSPAGPGGAEIGGPHTCLAGAHLRALEAQVRELREEVSRLRGIREAEDEIDSYFLSLQAQAPKEEAAQGVPSAAEWQTVTARTGAARSELVPASPVRLVNRYKALATLQEMEGEEETLGQEETPRSSHSEQIKRSTRTQRRRRRVLVIGDSILRGTEGPICRQDPSAQE
ncbi:uncharacterized protein LOC132251438 [Alligator mississippiensis]|uniref:uncharacterized protein LOC132251438 n=1 Tax=Alligator mississippiensis TaxID=8496 RepID=UPI002877C607|nr:uncharacterized protein LOC132251438 [Alligator mississippiensis]